MRVGKIERRLTDSVLFRFVLIFGTFTLLSFFSSGIIIYLLQMKVYKQQCIENIRSIGDYLERIIQDSSEEFLFYQNYYMQHFADVDIPYDFKEYHSAQRKYEALLNLYDTDISEDEKLNYNEFPDELKLAYFTYLHQFWLLTFEDARKSFNLPYTYYLVPREEIYHMIYMIDGERTSKDELGQKITEGENGKYLYLGDEYYDPPEKYKVQWKTWFSGERQEDFEVWNNEWGHTYAYYTPLIINGQKLGLIGTEVEVTTVNKAILSTSIKISVSISAGFILCIIIALILINIGYINKIELLESQMIEFGTKKDTSIAKSIRENVKGRNEIDSLSLQFANMILELENYMNNLLETRKELKDTRILANEMNVLANKDSLTGVRNKTAYDTEVRRLEWHVAEGRRDFCIAMIDLNFLKSINDTYGHSHGDAALKKLCGIICDVFAHSDVYRIGGDEFVVIMDKNEYNNAEALTQKFNKRIKQTSEDLTLDPWERVSAAIGYAYFESYDKTLNDVFRRADKNMYKHKKEMKAERID